MKPELITLDSLQRAARDYNDMLMELPSYHLGRVCEQLGLNLIEGIEGEHVLLTPRRKDGLLRPYTGEVKTRSEAPLMEIVPSVLKVRTGYMQLADNVNNYKQQRVTVRAGRYPSNQGGEHPYEVEILRQAIATMHGDVSRALFHAQYDPGDQSPTGVFDGFLKHVDDLAASGEIAEGQGNYIGFAKGTSLKAVAAALPGRLHPMLLDGDVDFICPMGGAQYLRAMALAGSQDQTLPHAEVERRLGAVLGVKGRVRVLGTSLWGANDPRLIVCRPGTLTVGLGRRDDLEAVQVRSPYHDPNVVQFWMQVDIGTRIDQWMPEVFNLVELNKD